ncbi:hypothetical protein KIPB_013386, partial [Kipferlia bialata]|eukprot:g13386.t1
MSHSGTQSSTLPFSYTPVGRQAHSQSASILGVISHSLAESRRVSQEARDIAARAGPAMANTIRGVVQESVASVLPTVLESTIAASFPHIIGMVLAKEMPSIIQDSE